MKDFNLNNSIKTILMIIIYYITGKISFYVFSQDMVITMAAFLPEGFALAAALIYGRKILPGIFIGQLLLALDSGLLPSASIGISIVNTLEAYIAIRLFNYFRLDRELTSTIDIFGLVGLILFILQPFSALFGNSILFFLGNVTIETFTHTLFFWWFGNVMGQLLFTPLLLILYFNRQRVQLMMYVYIIILFILLNYLLQITFAIDNVSILLMVTLPATLLLSTTNLSYASVASVVIASISLYFTHLGLGAFTKEASQIDNIIDLNFFMLSHIFLVLLIGVLFKEKENAINALESMAHYDYLTGLPNRHLLREEIHHTVFLAHNNQQRSAICFMDLDGFKEVNDIFGHPIGDGVLKKVVKRVKVFTQSEDAFLRIGGDEFLIIFNHIKSKEELNTKLTKILSTISKTMHIEGREINISFSVGVACCPEHGTTVEELMNASDNAMYEAKKKGKNQFIHA